MQIKNNENNHMLAIKEATFLHVSNPSMIQSEKILIDTKSNDKTIIIDIMNDAG